MFRSCCVTGNVDDVNKIPFYEGIDIKQEVIHLFPSDQKVSGHTFLIECQFYKYFNMVDFLILLDMSLAYPVFALVPSTKKLWDNLISWITRNVQKF